MLFCYRRYPSSNGYLGVYHKRSTLAESGASPPISVSVDFERRSVAQGLLQRTRVSKPHLLQFLEVCSALPDEGPASSTDLRHRVALTATIADGKVPQPLNETP